MSWKRRDREERGYHHGNLREALIQAARDLIKEKGPAGFTFADAARSAGVSAAGGVIVFAFLMYSAPIVLTPSETRKLLLRSGSALVIFLVVAVPLLLRMRRRRFAASTAWIRQGRRPTEAEQRMALGAPGHAVRVSAAMWALGAVFFAVPSAPAEPAAALYIFATVMLGGVSTSAVWYLIVDRVMRPVSARALGRLRERLAQYGSPEP